MIRPRRAMIALVAAASLGVSACGDDGGNLDELGKQAERQGGDLQQQLEQAEKGYDDGPAALPTEEPDAP